MTGSGILFRQSCVLERIHNLPLEAIKQNYPQTGENQTLPPNMAMAGVVTEKEKNLILSTADVALNPMTSGSGTNLKMLEYFAAGIPVISTPFGTRGLACHPGRELYTADISSFPRTITEFFAQPDQAVQQMIDRSRRLTEKFYDWAVIAWNMHDRLRDSF